MEKSNAVIDSDGPYDPYYLGANFTDANFKGAEVYLMDWIVDEDSPNEENVTKIPKKNIFLCRTIMPDGTINNRDCGSVPINFS